MQRTPPIKGRKIAPNLKSESKKSPLTNYNTFHKGNTPNIKDKDHELKYSKLIVPTRMRSMYWKFFGFPALEDGTVVSRERIICTLCKKGIMYNRNTSNLRMHLYSKHKHVLSAIEKKGVEALSRRKGSPKGSLNRAFVLSRDESGNVEVQHYRGKDTKEDGDDEEEEATNNVQLLLNETAEVIEECDVNPNIAVIFPNENGDLQEYSESGATDSMSDVVAELVITDLLPLNIVEDKGFRRFVATLNGSDVPTQKELTDSVKKIYTHYQYAVLEGLSSGARNVSLSVEQWTNGSGVSYVSFFAYYQQSSGPSLLARMLGCIRCTGFETVADWSKILDSLLIKWNVDKTKIQAVICSCAINELKSCFDLKKLVVVPCFLFVLQNACQLLCFDNENVASVLTKCRAIINYLHQNNHKSIIEYSKDDDSDGEPLCHDYPNLWLSTFNMLKGLAKRKDMLSMFVGTNETISCLMLDESEWSIVHDVLTVLDPLRVILNTLIEEKYALLSLLKPVIWQVDNTHFEIQEDDSILLQTMKGSVKHLIVESYSAPEVNTLLLAATSLDPRFKTFVQDNEHVDVENLIKNLLSKQIEAEGSKGHDSDPLAGFDKKQGRQSSINMILGNLCQNKNQVPKVEKARVEMIQYMSEGLATLEECPLEWWSRMTVKSPNIAQLAQKYTCIPAIAIPSVHTQNMVKYFKRRDCITDDVLDMMLFLHSNNLLFST